MAEGTKRVRVEQAIASSEDWAYAPGQIVDLPAAQAEAWISSGLATAVANEPKRAPETAAIEPTENTALARGRKHQAGR